MSAFILPFTSGSAFVLSSVGGSPPRVISGRAMRRAQVLSLFMRPPHFNMAFGHARPTLLFARALLNLFFLVLRGQSGRGASAQIHIWRTELYACSRYLIIIWGVTTAPLHQALTGNKKATDRPPELCRAERVRGFFICRRRTSQRFIWPARKGARTIRRTFPRGRERKYQRARKGARTPLTSKKSYISRQKELQHRRYPRWRGSFSSFPGSYGLIGYIGYPA